MVTDITGETLAAMAASGDFSGRGFPDAKWHEVLVDDDTYTTQNLTGDASIIKQAALRLTAAADSAMSFCAGTAAEEETPEKALRTIVKKAYVSRDNQGAAGPALPTELNAVELHPSDDSANGAVRISWDLNELMDGNEFTERSKAKKTASNITLAGTRMMITAVEIIEHLCARDVPAVAQRGADSQNREKQSLHGLSESYGAFAGVARRATKQKTAELYKTGERKPMIIVASGRAFFDAIPNGGDGYHVDKGAYKINLCRMANYVRDLCVAAILLCRLTRRKLREIPPDSVYNVGGPQVMRLVDVPALRF